MHVVLVMKLHRDRIGKNMANEDETRTYFHARAADRKRNRDSEAALKELFEDFKIRNSLVPLVWVPASSSLMKGLVPRLSHPCLALVSPPGSLKGLGMSLGEMETR